MDVVILLIFSVIFGGWVIWVSGRSEMRNPKAGDKRSKD